MGYPQRDRPSGGNRPFSRGSSDFNRDRGVRRPQMHKAVCSSCGKDCELPFRPTGERPVYCRDCFAKNGGGERRDNFTKESRDPRPPFTQFQNDFRNPHPAPHAQPHQSPHAHHDAQFAAINAKLDTLISLLSTNAPKAKEEKVKKEAAAPVADEAPVEKKAAVTKKKTTKKLVKTPTE